VWDRDPNPPVLGDPGDLDEGGRGLVLVTALTTEWGAYPADAAAGGKVVWAEIPVPPVSADGPGRFRRRR
jgi:hypothetical protein